MATTTGAERGGGRAACGRRKKCGSGVKVEEGGTGALYLNKDEMEGKKEAAVLLVLLSGNLT